MRTQLRGEMESIKNVCTYPEEDEATTELATLSTEMQINTEMIQELQNQLNTTLYVLQSRLTDTAYQAYHERVEINTTVTQTSYRLEEHQEVLLQNLSNQVQTLADCQMQLQDLSKFTRLAATFASSCTDLANLGLSSGYYQVSGSVEVYCDMERECCGKTGGWMRVADLDITDPSQQCPQGFRLRTDPKRVCERTVAPGCTSITFPTHGVQYSRVCGKVRAYQYGVPEAFGPYHNNADTLERSYVDGLSITHSQIPRKHIWTFAAARDEVQSNRWTCPCMLIDTPFSGQVPPFIGTDYFCETGSRNSFLAEHGRFYHEDLLWDGEGCGPNTSCCQFNSPPWFCKELPQPTNDDIEVRVCTNEVPSNENILLQLIELYVQ